MVFDQTIVVLGGGNALGAYLGGALEAIGAADIQPNWIVGVSAGAVTGALLAGNAPEVRGQKLKEFWAESQVKSGFMASHGKLRQYYNGWHAAFSALAGRPTIFAHRWPGLWSALPGSPNDVAIFNHEPLRATLGRLVDFERLNASEIRLSVGCVDLTSGEEVVFDTRRDRISADHLMASTAITPLFEPVQIDGRLLCDAGYVNNTPVDVAFAEVPTCSTLCIVVEPFSFAGPAPRSLDAALERSQDLMFASPTRKSIEALRREFAIRASFGESLPAVAVLHICYRSGPDELAVKALDFSPSSIGDRWAAGIRDARAALDQLERTDLVPGFNYIRVGAEAPHRPLQASGAR